MRTRLKASERERAKAVLLVQNLRRELHAEHARVAAAILVQTCARRWLARCQVHEMRGWRVQQQMSALQAAWQARRLQHDER